jgi:hypothetical protein
VKCLLCAALSPSMHNPLRSPVGPGFNRWGEVPDPFHHRSPGMDTSPDHTFSPRPPGPGHPEHFTYSPGTPKHDPFASQGPPRPGGAPPRLPHSGGYGQFVRGPGPQGSPGASPLPPDDLNSKAMAPRMFGHPGKLTGSDVLVSSSS